VEQVKRGASLTLAECFKMEYRIVSRCLAADDFYEGVRALLIDKSQAPKWAPVPSEKEIQAYFAPLPKVQRGARGCGRFRACLTHRAQELSLPQPGRGTLRPNYGLITETDLLDLLRNAEDPVTRKDVFLEFGTELDHPGNKQKLTYMLDRLTREAPDGTLSLATSAQSAA
jgi:hypothetical protein